MVGFGLCSKLSEPETLVNPEKYQGKKKAMCWVGVLKGTLLGPFWFVDARDNPVTLNQQTYLDMLQSKLWLILLTRRDLRRLWFMQDGATCHCTYRVLTWLHSKIGARIISRRSAIPWPLQRPDLNPLDFWHSGHLGKMIFDANPQTVPNLMQTVENACRTITPAQGVKAATNFEKRLHLCIQENGGHFQQLL